MSLDAVDICLLYPDLLGTYGDGGNATVLQRRLEWRGISSRLIPVAIGQAVPKGCEIYLMGGGEDQPQTSVTRHLEESGALHHAVDSGACVFAVCAGMQILGSSFAIAGGEARAGLGLLDITTVRGEGSRKVGELLVEPDPELSSDLLTGYENHGGVTLLGGEARPLGTVIVGTGNGDGKQTEGAVQSRIIGTYLHGPALARNPGLADLLLSWATGHELDPIDDEEIDLLRSERISAAKSTSPIGGRRRPMRFGGTKGRRR